MNFKTTIVLLIVLIAVGAVLYFTRGSNTAAPSETATAAHKLIDVSSSDVSKVVVQTSDGQKIVLEKTSETSPTEADLNAIKPPQTDWKITSPIVAPADQSKVDSLISGVLNASSTAETDIGSDAAKFGFDQPQDKVELSTKDKTYTVDFGRKQEIGNGVYARVNNGNKAEVIPADVLDTVDQPAASLRQTQLLSVPQVSIKQVTIDKRGAPKLVLQKQGSDWKIVQPTTMPADNLAVEDILADVTNLQASSFADTSKAPVDSFIGQPQMTVTISTAEPTTQPTTAPAASADTATIIFGRYDDLLKKNVYIRASTSDAIAKVGADKMDVLNKTPLDLRDTKVVSITPASVTRITISKDIPSTTQPATQPRSYAQVVLIRRPKAAAVMGPQLPTTRPATQPASTTQPAVAAGATTQPTTAPVVAKATSEWQIVDRPDENVADTKVTSLLDQLNPLKAEKFLPPTPYASYVQWGYFLVIETAPTGSMPAEKYRINVKPGANGQPPTAQYNDLDFEVTSSLTDAINQAVTSPTEAAHPPAPTPAPTGEMQP